MRLALRSEHWSEVGGGLRKYATEGCLNWSESTTSAVKGEMRVSVSVSLPGLRISLAMAENQTDIGRFWTKYQVLGYDAGLPPGLISIPYTP